MWDDSLVMPHSCHFSCAQNAAVGELSLYDMVGTPGVAADVSHINTKALTKVGPRKQYLARYRTGVCSAAQDLARIFLPRPF